LHLLADEPVSVEARCEAYLDANAPDLLHCRLSFATGIIAQTDLSALDARPVSRLAVVGSKATAVLDCSAAASDARLTVWAKRPDEHSPFGTAFTPGGVSCPEVAGDDPVRRTCEEFLDVVRAGVEPVTRAREATIVVAALEGIERSVARAASVDLGLSRSSHDLRLVSAPPAR